MPGPAHLRFRVLLPWIAKPVYHVLRGRIGSWDPVMAGLLVAESVFVAATALLIVVLGMVRLGDYPVSLLASLLYLVNFAIPNLRLAGLVDAGEGFFLLALLWSLSERKLGCLPIIASLGALTKETFVPLSITFTATWWLCVRRSLNSAPVSAAWIVGSWLVAMAAIVGLHWKIAGSVMSPIRFAASFHQNREYLHQVASSLWDRNLVYIFAWLLPSALPRLGKFPRSWRMPTAATVGMTLILDAYYGGAPGTVARELFSVAGPILTLSSASFLSNREPLPTEG